MLDRPTATVLDAALSYARRGWFVVPCNWPLGSGGCSCRKGNCNSVGKHPKTPRGFHDATTDQVVIKRWFGEWWPEANVAIATEPSRLLVVEVDPRNGGTDTLAELEEILGSLPETVEAISGGNGRHLVFSTSTPVKSRPIGSGVEIKSQAAMFVVEPSRHASGGVYRWEVEHHPDDRTTAEAPIDWVDAAFGQRGAGQALALAERIAEFRNVTLTSLAGTMRRRGASERAILAALNVENGDRCDPPLPSDEVRRIAKSIASYAPAPGVSAPIAIGAWSGDASSASRDQHNSATRLLPDRGLALTDLGNAERLVAKHGRDLLYCHPWRSWLLWDGRRWAHDSTGSVHRLAKDVVLDLYAGAAGVGNDDDRRAVVGFAKSSEREARLRAVVTLATTEPEIPVLPDGLDADPWLLNVENGTLDLRTGELRESRREDLLTRLAPVTYDPDASCPRWLAFLDQAMAGDGELVAFLQRAVGYTLTGTTGERVLFIAYGSGANGKSTFLEALRRLLGDYGLRTPTETLLDRRATIPNDIARLKGARYVSAVETEHGRRLAEAGIKDLTGGDTVSARFMRAEWFEFRPEFKLWLATNHKPIIRGTDRAIWDRIRLIPFTVTIPPELQDRELGSALERELNGILAWAVQGCLAWRRDGLWAPAGVCSATQSYRDEMDTLGQFVSECCVVDPNARVPVGELYDAYSAWCESGRERVLRKRDFGMQLAERGLVRDRGAKGVRLWVGIGLASEPG